MSDPMNDPEGPPNYDADRQSNTADDPETVEAPEGLPWELNPAVERPPGNYETLSDANEASGASQAPANAIDDTPATAAPAGPGDTPVTLPGTVTGPTSQADETGGDHATNAPINESGETAPDASDTTAHDTSHSTTEYEAE